MKRITIRREAPDGLSARAWTFWYADGRHALVLDHYSEEARPTRRHKFREQRTYSRLSSGRYSFSRILAEADAPLPDDVREEARRIFTDALDVAKESEPWKPLHVKRMRSE